VTLHRGLQLVMSKTIRIVDTKTLPTLAVRATSERFLPERGTFRAILANEGHWLQPMLVLSVHW
jgi:gamma-glutamyl:cysteine ligase YbdK (ATP-grasp superfamily)